MSLKKIFVLLSTAIALQTINILPAKAAAAPAPDPSPAILGQILSVTKSILAKVNDIPTLIYTLTNNFILYKNNMLQDFADDKTAGSLQQQFSIIGTTFIPNSSFQMSQQAYLNQLLFNGQATKDSLPNANDLVYSTVLGMPMFSPDPRNKRGSPPVDPLTGYIKNTSGISIRHYMPKDNWHGSQSDREDYASYYNTVMAIESFNAYVLGNQTTNLQNNAARSALVSLATSPNWMVKVGSDGIGRVLRNILLFESQSYLLLSELLKAQKELLTAQVMTNTLLINNNRPQESMMADKAQGSGP